MAKMMYSPQSPELLNALRAMGIEPNDTVRVVIDIRTGHATTVHVERMTDERIIDVVRIIAGDPHVRVEHGPTGVERRRADVERAIADPSSMVYRDRPRRQADDDWSIVVRPQDPGIVHVWCGNAQLHDAAPLSARAARLMGQQLMIAAREAERGA